MGRKYSARASWQVQAAKAMQTLISAATIRPGLADILLGTPSTPDDKAYEFSVMRCTAAGTPAGSFTPNALDPGDPAAIATSGYGTFTAEPTLTSNSQLLEMCFNARVPFRFVARPGFEFRAPATAGNGLVIHCDAAGGTPTFKSTILWEE